MNSRFTALGIDAGGTKIAAGLVSFPDGRLVVRREIPTRIERGAGAALEDLLRLSAELADTASQRSLQVNGIGVGVCELVDTAGEIVSANCLSWKSAEIRDGLASIAPAVVEADVRAAALAEATFGAGKSHRVFVYVTVGTGISSCLVIDGQPFLGARGATGTAASSALPQADGLWSSDVSVTLEQVASGPALVARLTEMQGRARSGQEVVNAARAGDTKALLVVQSAGEALGAMVAWLVNVLDPAVVVVGGGLGLSEGPYWESLEAGARKHIWSDLHRDLPIVRAVTGADAGVIGAATAAWKKAHIKAVV